MDRHPPLRRVTRGSRVSCVTSQEPQCILTRTSSLNQQQLSTVNRPSTMLKPQHAGVMHSKTIAAGELEQTGNQLTTVSIASDGAIQLDEFNAQCAYFHKLGYKQERVLQAVQKCTQATGCWPDNDKILAELIKLGRDVSDNDVANDVTADATQLLHNNSKVDSSASTNVVNSHLCPYGRKCTYGVKCKYAHPERRAHLTATERLLRNNERKPLCATSSLDPRIFMDKDCLVRTGSLNLKNRMTNDGRARLAPCVPTPQVQPPPAWPWLSAQSQHSLLSRHSSAPMRPKINDSAPKEYFESRRSYAEDTAGLLPSSTSWRGSRDSAIGSTSSNSESVETGTQNFYTPSTAVWGEAEFSITVPLRDAGRSKAYYHLSQIFPEQKVDAIMSAYPHLTDPQHLCRLIVDACSFDNRLDRINHKTN